MTKPTFLIILSTMTLSGYESYGGFSSRDASTNGYASDSHYPCNGRAPNWTRPFSKVWLKIFAAEENPKNSIPQPRQLRINSELIHKALTAAALILSPDAPADQIGSVLEIYGSARK